MRKYITGLIIIAAAVTGYVISYPVFKQNRQPATHNAAGNVGGEVTQSPKAFTAVVFDNHPDARPQFGLSTASIVFETFAEGGSTRILGLFDDRADAAKIGPVRSARPYFVDWAYGAGIALAHSGGSIEGLNKIASLGSAFHDINEFFAEHYFWRDRARRAPHNLFTSTALLKNYFGSKNWELASGQFGWSIDPEPASGLPATNEILVDFSYPQFAARFVYDPGQNNYLRYLGGKADKDGANGAQIRAGSVVVLYTTSTVIDKNLLTVDVVTSGTGRAVVFTGGKVLQARWQKASDGSPLKLLDADNSVIKLNPGQTWIEVLDQTGTAVWK